MCAVNVPKTVSFWVDEFGQTSLERPMALHALVERVSIFTQEDQNASSGVPSIRDLFTEYGALLASQVHPEPPICPRALSHGLISQAHSFPPPLHDPPKPYRLALARAKGRRL